MKTIAAVSPIPAEHGRGFIAPWLVPVGAIASVIPGVPTSAALAAGAVLGLSGFNLNPGRTHRFAHLLLQLSVVGLGAGMNLALIGRTGIHGLVVTIGSISLTLLLARWLGRKLGVTADATLLVGAGTAICGGSAIAALSGALKPKARDTTVALATVFLLNAVALVIFPPIGRALGLSQVAFGWWAALAIHDTSSVVGAGLAYGPGALAVATAVKLARALWIVPLTFWLVRRRNRRTGEARGRISFPWFIAGFGAFVVLGSMAPSLAPALRVISHGSQRAMSATLFLIGAGITRETVREIGFRPLALGLALWIIAGGVSLFVIKSGWLF